IGIARIGDNGAGRAASETLAAPDDRGAGRRRAGEHARDRRAGAQLDQHEVVPVAVADAAIYRGKADSANRRERRILRRRERRYGRGLGGDGLRGGRVDGKAHRQFFIGIGAPSRVKVSTLAVSFKSLTLALITSRTRSLVSSSLLSSKESG